MLSGFREHVNLISKIPHFNIKDEVLKGEVSSYTLPCTETSEIESTPAYAPSKKDPSGPLTTIMESFFLMQPCLCTSSEPAGIELLHIFSTLVSVPRKIAHSTKKLTKNIILNNLQSTWAKNKDSKKTLKQKFTIFQPSI